MAKTIREIMKASNGLRPVTPWEEVKVNDVYHIPPIASLKRREVTILTKNDDSATYSKNGEPTSGEATMHKTSVFAKFLVKKKDY